MLFLELYESMNASEKNILLNYFEHDFKISSFNYVEYFHECFVSVIRSIIPKNTYTKTELFEKGIKEYDRKDFMKCLDALIFGKIWMELNYEPLEY